MSTILTFLLSAFTLGALIFPSEVLAQSSFRYGGSWQTSIEGMISKDRAPDYYANSTFRVQARTLTSPTLPTQFFLDGRIESHGPLGQSGSGLQSEGWKTALHLDRLHARHHFHAVDLTLGKQFVNWGVGHAFSPTDLFHPPDPLAPDRVRPGVLSAVLHIPTGPLDYWSIAWAKGKYGLRRRGYTNGTDWSMVVVSDRDGTVLGMDAKKDVGISLVAAGAYRLFDSSVSSQEPPGQSPILPVLDPPLFDGLIGADYSWYYGSLLWIGEYAFRWTKEHDFRHQTFQRLTYAVDDFTSFFGSLLADLSGNDTHWNLGVNTALGPQSDLAVTVQFPFRNTTGDPIHANPSILSAHVTYTF